MSDLDSYLELQEQWIKHTGLRVGDTVLVIEDPTSHRIGMPNVQHANLAHWNGKTGKLTGIKNYALQIGLDPDDIDRYIPFFCVIPYGND